jgi:hypothetical protein
MKDRILSIVKRRGPSLPVHVAKETQMSMLFASAFLSELIAEGKIKISTMKVGGSPLYYIPGQESMLENFSNFLKSKEKEAFLLLKENKFLVDKEQDPAIRVALRGIKDFAMPFKSEEEIVWRYFTIPEEEFSMNPETTEEVKEEIKEEEKLEDKKERVNEEQPEIVEEEEKEEEEIIEEEETEQEELEEPVNEKLGKKQEKPKKKKKNIKITKKQDESFFNKIKEFLQKTSVDILDIIDINRGEIILKVKSEEKQYLIFAFNKKNLNEKDIIASYKKASSMGLKYSMLCFGDIQKKIKELIFASKDLIEVNKIEETE